MRIGINTLFLVPGDVGGTEVYLRENLKEMIAANPLEIFVLFTSSDNSPSLRQDFGHYTNIEFIRLPFRSALRPLRIVVEQTMLPWQVWRKKVDVLWSPGYTAPLFCPCPQVATIHDLQYKTHPHDVTLLERIALEFLIRNACRRCEAIITVSEFSKSEVLRFGFADESRINVVYEAADPRFAEPVDLDLGRFGLSSTTPYILCVAHTYPHKRVHNLVHAFGLLSPKIPHHLVLVGTPRRGEPKVEEAAQSLPDRGRLHRIQGLSYDELKGLYQKASLFVLPSEYEGFGLPLLEALMAGTMAVTSDQASLPEVGGEHAVYVDGSSPKELAIKIQELLEMPESVRSSRIARGVEWALSFSWQRSAAETLSIIRWLDHRT